MQNTERLKNLTDSLNRRDKLEMAEYASVALSVVGTVAATIWQQVALAAVPLTLAVSLNTINRYRLSQQSLKEIPADTSITSSFDDLFPGSQSSEGLPKTGLQKEISLLRESVNDLQESTAEALMQVRLHVADQLRGATQKEPVNLKPIYQALGELQAVMERLQNSALTQADWEQMNVQILLIKESINNLSDTAEFQPEGAVSLDLNQIKTTIKEIQNEQQRQLEQLLHRVEDLEHKNRQIVKPCLQRLVAQVKQLQKNQGG